MGSRRKSREIALQMLFQWEQGGHTPEHVLATFLAEKKLDDDARAFAQTLFLETAKETADLDRALGERSEHWRPERMAAVDRNVLRLALHELLHHPETPPKVVINEALEIARRYSGEESVEFVNGVLDGVLKNMPVSG